jgi:hypothetical protein
MKIGDLVRCVVDGDIGVVLETLPGIRAAIPPSARIEWCDDTESQWVACDELEVIA